MHKRRPELVDRTPFGEPGRDLAIFRPEGWRGRAEEGEHREVHLRMPVVAGRVDQARNGATAAMTLPVHRSP